MNWKDLSIRDRAAIIRQSVSDGIYNLAEIRNKFDEGGDINWQQRLAETFEDNSKMFQQSQNNNLENRNAAQYKFNRSDRKLFNSVTEDILNQAKQKEASEILSGRALPKGEPLIPLEQEIMDFTPVGDIFQGAEVVNELKNKNYLGAAILSSGLILPNSLSKFINNRKALRELNKIIEDGPRNYEFMQHNAMALIDNPKGYQYHVDLHTKPHNPTDPWTGRATSIYEKNIPEGRIVNGEYLPSQTKGQIQTPYIWFTDDYPYQIPSKESFIVGKRGSFNTKTGIVLDGNEINFPLSKGFSPYNKDIKFYRYIPFDDSVGTHGISIYEKANNIKRNPWELFAKGGDKNTINHPKYNAKQVNPMYDYLRENGLTNEQASGILGNIAVESYLNADMKQIKGPAYGLIQAEGPRKKAMLEYNETPYSFGSGLSPEEQQQLDYIIDKGVQNYTPGEWGMSGFSGARQARNAFLNVKTTRRASDIITRNYLRPSKPAYDRRRKMSDYYYNTQKERIPYQIEFWNNPLKSWEEQ